jgi:hypothetical protein
LLQSDIAKLKRDMAQPPAPKLSLAEQAALKDRAAKLAERFGSIAGRDNLHKAKKMVDDLAERCNLGNPMVTVEKFKTGLKLLTAKQLIALRLLADRSMGCDETDIASMLELTPKKVLGWTQNNVFAFLLTCLSTGYNLAVLRPLVVEVLVEGLNRREPDVDGKPGKRIFDTVTGTLVREAKSMLGIATDVNQNVAPQLSPEEIKKQDKAAAEFLRNNPIARAALANSVGAVEQAAPKGFGNAVVDSDGQLKDGDGE